jgi:hypothetical protein
MTTKTKNGTRHRPAARAGRGGYQDVGKSRPVDTRYHRRTRLIDRMTYDDGLKVGAIRRVYPNREDIGACADANGQDTQDNGLVCTQTDGSRSTMQQVETQSPIQGDTTPLPPIPDLHGTDPAQDESQAVTAVPTISKPLVAQRKLKAGTLSKPSDPIRMTNRPKGVRTNRGETQNEEEVIRRRVSNKKLRLILTGKRLPRECKRQDPDFALLVTSKNFTG